MIFFFCMRFILLHSDFLLKNDIFVPFVIHLMNWFLALQNSILAILHLSSNQSFLLLLVCVPFERILGLLNIFSIIVVNWLTVSVIL